ncbi:hypothetical protein PR202_ga22291 [Eleusine coracana subsp. coracana]|uniref:Chalcone synthase n=1 Tax=Eleusine coracana subsp. coracana TaxID=191504 RepID=A0AAV5D2R3_ELECO|nr:hypothetical protein PR202_ga22291 [Eleusine coracana subsp. coracana]
MLAIGTSNPMNCVRQNEYADWYFRVTKRDHLGKWKDKMKRICEKSGIRKRYLHHTEKMIHGHPELLDPTLPSLRTRLGITEDAVPELAAAAATKAIAQWGRPAGDITHLIVNSANSVAGSPGADLRVAALLGLQPSVQRTMLCLHGCSGGCLALRLAKDLAENNIGARVLVVCVEVFVLCFRGPDATRLDELVAMTLFGDGAGAAIVGTGPVNAVERPIFHMVSASQATLPGTENVVELKISENGVDFEMSSVLPKLVRENIKQCLVNTLAPVGLASDDLNGLFWAAHPGGRAILDSYETALGLEPGKLAASRRVLSEYGNMFGATIFFVLDEMRRRHRSCNEEREKGEWGVMLGLGPGISVEMMVLHAVGTGVED